tara:strand:+ start:828 stop:1319 length:492 start_codon:yes stop_codon:yes gene_type:complete
MSNFYPALAVIKNGRPVNRITTEDLNENNIPYAIEAPHNDPQGLGTFDALKVYYAPASDLNVEEYICHAATAAGFTDLQVMPAISIDYKPIPAGTVVHVNPNCTEKMEYIPAHNRTDVYVRCNGIDEKVISAEGNLTAGGGIVYATYGSYGTSVGLQEALLDQ